MRKAAWVIGLIALVAVVAIGLSQASDHQAKTVKPLTLAEQQQDVEGAPAPLARVHAQANEILPGGLTAFEKELATLKGHPVVINKWGSWCDPCRREFPHFQRVSSEVGTEVAFLGVNVLDNPDQARKFLADYPVTYPSYKDDDTIGRKLGVGGPAPQTIFVDKNGEVVMRTSGEYSSDKELRADVKRYLGV